MVVRRTAAKLVRFAPEELARITARAHACGLTPARFIRETALGASPHARPHRDHEALLRALARIGAQLERLNAQAMGYVSTELAAQLIAALEAHRTALRQLVHPAVWNASPADWNHMRRAVSTFLTATLGDVYHSFRRAVVRAIPLAHEGGGRIPDRSPQNFWRIVEKMPEHAKPCSVVLVATGMRVGEYLRTTTTHLKPAIFGLEVPGTKTGESRATVFVDERLWPWLEAGIPSPLRYGWMRKYWVRACKAAGITNVRLHDLRHCYGQWAVSVGVPEAAVQTALRHATPEMTRHYTKTRDKGEVARDRHRADGGGAVCSPAGGAGAPRVKSLSLSLTMKTPGTRPSA